MAECANNNQSLSASNPAPNPASNSIINNDTAGISGGIGTGISSLFNINKIQTAYNDYLALNQVVNQIIGYEVRWFRAVPQQRSKDVLFQEYTLSNVEENPLCLKVIVPGGNIPDSKYNYDLMGLEYEIPLEVQIDKKYWESFAGIGTAPQKKDIVYFAMPNKLYQVESTYLLRGFMEQETAWKINLKKYQPEASRKESTELQSTIDQYTVSVESIFGEQIDNDVKKLVNDHEFNQFNSTEKDKYKTFDVSLNVISNALNIYGTIVAQSFYDLQSSNLYDAVTYTTTDSITSTDDRSLVVWFAPRTINTVNKEYSVNSIEVPISPYVDPSTHAVANYDIKISSPTMYDIGDTFVIYRPGALNFYATVLAIDINPLVYHCVIDDYVQEHLESIRPDWYLQPNYKMMVKSPVNIIDGTNDFDEHNFAVNVYANQYVKINYGSQTYIASLNEKLKDDKWYGMIVNIGNTWQQYNIYVWEKHETDKNEKLQIFYYETMTFTPEDVVVNNFTINKSPAYLTNLRLYNTTVEEEKQRNELLSFFTRDAEQIILADSCDTRLKIPYVSKQR